MKLHFRTGLLALLAAICMAEANAVSFPEWQAEHFSTLQLSDPAISGPDADPDGDGYRNLLEYAFGGLPWDALAPGYTGGLDSSGTSLIYPEFMDATDLIFRLEESFDLQQWNWIIPNASSRSILSDTDGIRWVSLAFGTDMPTSKFFARIRAVVSQDDTSVLNAPSGLSTSFSVPLRVRLTWNDNTKSEEGYAVERRVNSGSWEEIGTTTEDINSFGDPAVQGSTEYFYRVSAIQGEAASAYSNEYSISLPLDTDGDGIPDADEATYGLDPFLYSSGNNGASDGWWVLYGLDPFTVASHDTDGDGRSDAQEFLDGTDPLTADSDPDENTEPPNAPTKLALTTLESGANVLTWVNPESTNGTIVERTGDGANWQRVGVIFGGSTTFADGTALPDVVYFYRVAAFF